MLKLHEVKMSLALTQNNRFAGATQEPSYSQENYYCAHCGEPRHTAQDANGVMVYPFRVSNRRTLSTGHQ